MSYALRDHTADVAVEATAPTLSELFAAVADGLTAASCETIPETGERFSVSVSAESGEALLFDYLDQLIYERDVRMVLPADNRCSVSAPDETSVSAPDESEEWNVEANARGVPLADVAAREIKAVTYSEMAVERRGDEWYAYVVLDV